MLTTFLRCFTLHMVMRLGGERNTPKHAYSAECVEGEFCEVELPFYGVLRSSPLAPIGPRAGVGAKRRCPRGSARRSGSLRPPGRRSLCPPAGRRCAAARRAPHPLPPRT